MTHASVPTISLDELKTRLSGATPFEFWNVLTDDYFKGEMIPGSRRVPLDRVGREVSSLQLPNDAVIVVYCAGPSCPQSAAAARKLLDLGYSRVSAFEGGLEEWKQAGGAIEREALAAGSSHWEGSSHPRRTARVGRFVAVLHLGACGGRSPSRRCAQRPGAAALVSSR